MSTKTPNPTQNDPLAYASETPDVAALFKTAEAAQYNPLSSLATIARAEAERYQDRPGKDGTGRLWQKNLPNKAEKVRPWDGRPDVDCSLTDEICENEVDLDLIAHAMAVPGAETSYLNALTAAQSAELVAIYRYVRRAVENDLSDDEEFLAQLKATLGVAVLNPGWEERYELVQREIDLESLINQVAQEFGPENAKAVYTAILDPTLEAPAVQALGQVFSNLPNRKLKSIVTDLRATQKAVFLNRQLAGKRPTLRALAPGYNYFVAGAAGKLKDAYLHLVIERYAPAKFLALARDRNWNEAFVERALATQGDYSALGEGMRNKILRTEMATEDRSIEIWTTDVFQFDDEIEAGGYYSTVFSPHVQPGAEGTTPEHFGEHILCDYAHRESRFIAARREVNGPGVFDSRGVPDVTQSNSNVIRNLQTALVCRAHLEVDPPRALIGTGWKNAGGSINTPGAIAENMIGGADVKDLSPAKGNPQVGELAIERVERSTHRQFAFPDAEVHPARWQPRALRKSKRALIPFRQAYTQLVILCYQNFEPYELAQIIGHWPQLTLADVLQHRITLSFDPRGLDSDWRKQTLDFFVSLLGIDRGGLFDTGAMSRVLGNLTDPALTDSIMQDQQGASAKQYRKVQNDINDIMLGNPPPLVELDATAGMQLKMAMQVIGQNQRYQQLLAQDEQVRENLKTYVENLQHSEQETQISPQQGRLGVAARPQRPVQKGAV